MDSANLLGLVGDIGGTNARFALMDLSAPAPAIRQPRSLLCSDHPTAEAAIDHYLAQVGANPRPNVAVIAVAGPVIDGRAAMTNLAWTLSEAALAEQGFKVAKLINDYAALALAAADLKGDDLGPIGPDLSAGPDQPVAVIGAGTGFGVAVAVPSGGRLEPLVTEGGHVGFAPVDKVETEILKILERKFGRVSVERLLSGPGLRNLYAALAEIRGTPLEPPSAGDITRLGLDGQDALCEQTLDRFCAVYGSVAGDMALALGARGGVYLAGGIAPSILPRLAAGCFRERFEAKGRLSEYTRSIPTKVILQPHTALVGAAEQLRRLHPLGVVKARGRQ